MDAMDGRSRAWMGVGLGVSVAAVSAYVLVGTGHAADGAGGRPPALVAVAEVQKVDLPRYLSGIGTLEAVQQVEVPAEVGAESLESCSPRLVRAGGSAARSTQRRA